MQISKSYNTSPRRTPISDTIRFCESCGKPFQGKRSDARYCDRSCQKNGARTARRVANELRFIGVDGEGSGQGREHRYVLLGVGQRQIENNNGLHYEEILSFVYECFLEEPSAIYCGFFLGYDFAQWFKTLPCDRAKRIFTTAGYALRKRNDGRPPLPVDVGKWQIDALPNLKRVRIRYGENGKWLYVCDTGPFFQTSLLSVIDPRGWDIPVVSQEEYETILRGKGDRSSAVLGDPMRFYNRLENDVLGRVLVRYNEGLTHAGVRLSRKQWFGPGQASQKWLRSIGCPTRDEISNAIPPGVWDFAVRTYYAGWFEIPIVGHIPNTLWEYDINSAYPFIMANLPCLLHGQWENGRGEPPNRPGTYTMCSARVQGSNPFLGAMLHRRADGTRLCRPHSTSGNYWLHELAAAKNAGLVDSVHYDEWWQYTPCDCPPPLRGMAELYQERLRIGKDSPQGKAFKLIYNSGYGKFAQSVGEPIFGNAIYASLITAGCREMILNAIATHPYGARAVAMVATDGVYFLRRHPGLRLGKGLGEWEEKAKQNTTLFKPGVYWDDNTRAAIEKGESPVYKARGVNAKAFSRSLRRIDQVFDDWNAGEWIAGDSLDADMRSMLARDFPDIVLGPTPPPHKLAPAFPHQWPSVEFPIDFAMTSIGQALQWNKWEECGRVHDDHTANQSSWDDCKRDPSRLRYDGIDRVWRTGVHPFVIDESESTPYDKRFGEEYREEQWADAITPDGTLTMLITSSLHVERATFEPGL